MMKSPLTSVRVTSLERRFRRFLLEMPKHFVRWILPALFSIPLLAQAQRDALRSDQREVLHVDSVRLAAVLRADTTALKRLMTPDWLLISSVTGERLSRSAYLAGLASGRRRMTTATHDSLQVRVYGTTAILTGRTRSRMGSQDSSITTTAWFTHVYVKENGQWRMASMHVSADLPRPSTDRRER